MKSNSEQDQQYSYQYLSRQKIQDQYSQQQQDNQYSQPLSNKNSNNFNNHNNKSTTQQYHSFQFQTSSYDAQNNTDEIALDVQDINTSNNNNYQKFGLMNKNKKKKQNQQFSNINDRPNAHKNQQYPQQDVSQENLYKKAREKQKNSTDSFNPYSKNQFQFQSHRSSFHRDNSIHSLLNNLRKDQADIKTQVLLQEKNNRECIQSWARQIIDYLKINQKRQSFSSANYSSSFKIRQLQEQNLRLQKQLEKEKIKGSRLQSSNPSNHYQARINQLMQENKKYQKMLKQKQKIIQDLYIQNQQLNESIFDYQQKIIAFDLEVQKKVSELLERNQNNSVNINNNNNQKYLAKIQELNKQIQQISKIQSRNMSLNVKQNFQKQNQMRIKQRELQYRQKQLQQKDEQIFKRFQETQYQKQQNLRKQRQLINFQDQLERRLGDIQIKENQLQLIKHQLNQNYKHFNNQLKYQHHPHTINPFNQVSSNNNQQGGHYQTPNRQTKERSFTYSSIGQYGKEKHLSSNYPNHNSGRNNNLSGQQARNTQTNNFNYQTTNNSNATYKTNERSLSKNSPIAKNKLQTPVTSNLRAVLGKGNTPASSSIQHNININIDSGRQRQRQKAYNKTKSNQVKIIDHQTYQNNPKNNNNKKKLYQSNASQSIKGSQLNGIQEKLERLKQQIRKEIDSIH